MVWWPKLVASKLNNKILLFLTETNKFIVVFNSRFSQSVVKESEVKII